MDSANNLLMFYGKECPHCETMMPLVEKLEKELGTTVQRFETWHDTANAELMKKYDPKDECGGVPYFYNTKSDAAICGEAEYEILLNWAKS